MLFAAIVVWGHAFGVGGFGGDPIWRFSHGSEQAGFLAVGGFFVLSGFLIARSYESIGNLGRFLWHRVLRIFPGYWVCLLVTAFAIAPLAYAHQHHSLAGFLHVTDSPAEYVWSNWWLINGLPTIGTLIARSPYPSSLNGSLWTLPYEFLCYCAVALLGFAGLLRRRRALVLGAALTLWAAFFVPIVAFGQPREFISVDLELFSYFFFGAAAYLYRDVIAMRGWVAAVFAVAAALSLPTRAYALLIPPCLSYVALYAAMRWGPRSFDRKLDLSYGTYIYAFPVQQLLVIYGLNALGFAPYLAITLAVTALLAFASWIAIERPSLSLKHAAWPHFAKTSSGSAPTR